MVDEVIADEKVGGSKWGIVQSVGLLSSRRALRAQLLKRLFRDRNRKGEQTRRSKYLEYGDFLRLAFLDLCSATYHLNFFLIYYLCLL